MEEYIGGDDEIVDFILPIAHFVFILIHLVVVALSGLLWVCCYDLLSYLYRYTKATDTTTAHYRGLPWMTKVKHLDPNCNSRKQACR